MSQENPSQTFSEEYSEAFKNILTISYLSGVWFVREKQQLDYDAVEAINNSNIKNSFPDNFLKEFHENVFSELATQMYIELPDFGNFEKLLPSEAIKWLKSKLLIKSKKYIDAIEDATAAKVDIATKLAFYDNAKHLTDFVTQSLETGESLGSAIKRLGSKDLLNKIGITKQNRYYLETVVRTNQVSAINAGMRNESIQNVNVSFYRYVAIDDDRITDVCRDLDGIIKSKNDPLWSTHLPPNHYSCRSRVTTIGKLYAEEVGIKESTRIIKSNPEKGFSQDPAKTWNAPTVDMRQRLADHLGVDRKEIPKGAIFEPQ